MSKILKWIAFIALLIAGIFLLFMTLGRRGDLIEKAHEIIRKSESKEREVEREYQRKLKEAEQRVESIDKEVAEKRREVWNRIEELEKEGKVKTTEDITYEDAKEHLKKFLQS